MLYVRLAIALLLVLLFTPVVRSEIVSIEVSDVAGEFKPSDPWIVVPFDMGVSFQYIDEITVRIVGEIKSYGTYRYTNGLTGESDVRAFEPQLGAGLPGPLSSPGGSFRRMDDDGSTWEVKFGLLQPHVEDYFTHLLDGSGELRLSQTEDFFTIDWISITVIDSPVFEIERVELIFDGITTEVPEPSSACLAILAAITLTFFSRKRRRAKPS
ncbi:MAG: hypothetical protein IID44_02675 [Planctomycetes bacterium]|nr:hypothetical protein [Planctomycetota bacterium]